MIPDLDIWRSAQLMVKRYGEDVGTQAAIRTDQLFDAGEVDGKLVHLSGIARIDMGAGDVFVIETAGDGGSVTPRSLNRRRSELSLFKV